MLPAAIWPYLWLTCGTLAGLCCLTSQRKATHALLAILSAYVAVRVAVTILEQDPTANAVGAFIWAATSTAVFRLSFRGCSGVIALSALCYFWANFSGAPRVVGSIPFVASDLLMVAAMVGIGWDGVACFLHRVRRLVSSSLGAGRLGASDVSGR